MNDPGLGLNMARCPEASAVLLQCLPLGPASISYQGLPTSSCTCSASFFTPKVVDPFFLEGKPVTFLSCLKPFSSYHCPQDSSTSCKVRFTKLVSCAQITSPLSPPPPSHFNRPEFLALLASVPLHRCSLSLGSWTILLPSLS